MATVNVTIPEELKAFIETQVVEEGYASASEYLLTLIREAQKSRAKEQLEAMLQEAIDSGPPEPLTKQDWAEMRREALEGLAGESIRP